MLKRLVVLALLAPVLALAQAAEPAGKLTSEAIIKRTLEGRMGGVKVEAVAKTPYLGLYEVRVDNESLYTDDKMNYIFSGNITIYTFLHPILSQDSHDKSKAVGCSGDKS